MPVESQLAAIRDALVRWYRGAARDLPWRAPPGAPPPEPYRVWLSEVMLQQTTVAAVKPYFERFITRWPTLGDLATADPADVLAAWAGLGYYSRARNLIACARAVAEDHGADFPASETALRGLPGIGDYTAAAIAAIAFGDSKAVPVDANIERVVARLFAIREPLPQARAAIRAAARALWPIEGGGDFAQGMMDLGSLVCTARSPDCGACPLRAACRAHAQGIAAELPVKRARRARPLRHGRAMWLERGAGDDRAVWLVRRPERGMLGGMRALPGTDWGDAPLDPAPGAAPLGVVRHVFTHFALDLAVDRAGSQVTAQVDGKGEWWPVARLDAAGLPTLYRRAARIAMEG